MKGPPVNGQNGASHRICWRVFLGVLFGRRAEGQALDAHQHRPDCQPLPGPMSKMTMQFDSILLRSRAMVARGWAKEPPVPRRAKKLKHGFECFEMRCFFYLVRNITPKK